MLNITKGELEIKTKFFAMFILLLGFMTFAMKEVSAYDIGDFEKIDSIEIESSDVTMSEILTFDELVQEIAKDENLSESEVRNNVLQVYSFEKGMNQQSVNELSRKTYRTFTKSFTVTNFYKPSAKFYAETSEGGRYVGILKILNVGMDRYYNGISKQFSGQIYTQLESAGVIFFIVNGDFYNNGTTTVNGGVNIGVGQVGSVNFGVSYASNHYQYVYVEDRYLLGR